MESPNEPREANLCHDLNNNLSLTPTLDPSSTDDSRSPRAPSTSSSPGLKSLCAICLYEIKKEDGKAIFTAECSHTFHFNCITLNVKHGNRICPLCRTQWKQVPLCDDYNNLVTAAQRGFEDDESLPHSETQIQSGNQSGVEIKLFPELSAVAKMVRRDEFAVLVHLKAEGVSDDRLTRAPLDLITVLDVSGSMEGVKLELMKNAMRFVIQNLGEKDRLSVISFSDTARRLFPLRLMSEIGKEMAMQAVNSLVSDGGTNIAEGLKIGARVISDRRWKNPVSGMMLLSDGQDNYTLAHGGVREFLLPGSSRIPIHTFGFGSDHDAELLHTISEVSSGTFSFIETETVIQDAFAQCIGGLLSVVILEQVVEIECLHEQELRISSIKAGSYRSRIASDSRTATIDVGDMYAEEERDFLVILEIPCGDDNNDSMSLVKVRCVYKDSVTREIVRVESEELSIQRPMELTGEEVMCVEVDRQLNRFLVSQAMSEARVLADGGDLNAAVELLRTRERELSVSPSAQSGDRLCHTLSSELTALQERMTSRRMYRSSGRAYFFSSMSSHSAQRATARGDSTQVYSPVQAYQTSPMARMVSRSQDLGSRNPYPLQAYQTSHTAPLVTQYQQMFLGRPNPAPAPGVSTRFYTPVQADQTSRLVTPSQEVESPNPSRTRGRFSLSAQADQASPMARMMTRSQQPDLQSPNSSPARGDQN